MQPSEGGAMDDDLWFGVLCVVGFVTLCVIVLSGGGF